MAWRRPGDKPLSEPMMVSLPMHICVTRPQCVNKLPPPTIKPYGDFMKFYVNYFEANFMDWCQGISYIIALIWMSLDLSDDKATSYYLRHCWPKSLSPCGVNRPHWVTKGNISLMIFPPHFKWDGNFICSHTNVTEVIHTEVHGTTVELCCWNMGRNLYQQFRQQLNYISMKYQFTIKCSL